MRLAVLTTQTLHHAYFVRELAKFWPIERVFVETRSAKAPFDTAHPFEVLREVYESELWFEGADGALEDLAETTVFDSLNSPSAIQELNDFRADVAVVFGTGKLSVDVIRTCPNGMVNLHGGDPEKYRGLDTHLWAVYHREFDELVTTLHYVNATLDDGDIIGREPINLLPGTKLHQLRQFNTKTCVKLVKDALVKFEKNGSFPVHPQIKSGRSYSFMPTVLKELCVNHFERYTKNL
jgi:methionyl-tRNA formyltransferase